MSRRAIAAPLATRATKRLLAGILAGGFVAAFAAAVLPSCDTGARGIEACRTIEDARCEASKACKFSDDDVQSCKLFYHDECLHGLENATGEPKEQDVKACVAAVKAAAACEKNGVETMKDCTAVALVPATAASAEVLEPCKALQRHADFFAACAFIIEPPEAGTPPVEGGVQDAGQEADAFIL